MSRPQRSRRLLGAAAVLIVVAAIAAAVLVGHAGGHGSPARGSGGGTAASAGSSADGSSQQSGLAAAARNRQQAAAWVASQVDHGTIIGCDPLTCSALLRLHFPAASLSQITASSADPLGTGIVVATASVRSQLGSRLETVYAPLVLASFGTGVNQVQVRATAIGGATAYLADVRADVQERRAAGAELIGNRAITEPPAARAELSAGAVDSRILITLATLSHKFAVRIAGFSDAGPGAAAGVPLRAVTIDAPAQRYLSELLAFLRAQRPPLLGVVLEHRANGTTQVQLQFSAPSPTGLLNAGLGL